MRQPLLRASLDRGTEAECRELVLERLGVVGRHLGRNGLAVARAVEETQDAVAQMRIGTVEDDLAAVAGRVEAVDRREHGADVELPAALEEVRDLVEEQRGVTPVDPDLLGADASALADERNRAADGTHQGRGKVRRLDDGVDGTWRLFDRDGARHRFGQAQSPRDVRQDLALPRAIHAYFPPGTPSCYLKRGMTSSQSSRSAVITFWCGIRLPGLSSARMPSRPSFSRSSCRRATTLAEVPTIIRSRSTSS